MCRVASQALQLAHGVVKTPPGSRPGLPAALQLAALTA